MDHQMSSDMNACIQACHECHSVCLRETTQHCLQMGGKHAQPEHIQIMLSCAEICQSCATIMLIGSALHVEVCATCARICEACAQSCEQVGEMDECVKACRQCAKSCQQMAGMSH